MFSYSNYCYCIALQVQVIVLNADMRCVECRDRVSKVLSKMDNTLIILHHILHIDINSVN